MGICSSCLGFARRSSDSENPETSRLLYDESYRPHYGSAQQQHQRTSNQPDPESVRREREALESICHAMSDEVIDIFTTLPAPSSQTRKASVPPQITRPETPEPSPEIKAYKSIRRGKAGPISAALNTDKYRWNAAKSAIVGADDDDRHDSQP
ncbi:hypothetical protein G7Y79_00015g039720 [Physcia stellaris]|nr:hypothetical protein G7Y79_00015g039720 [Physcia stellaris]